MVFSLAAFLTTENMILPMTISATTTEAIITDLDIRLFLPPLIFYNFAAKVIIFFVFPKFFRIFAPIKPSTGHESNPYSTGDSCHSGSEQRRYERSDRQYFRVPLTLSRIHQGTSISI
jgi:hypothetical protein